LMIAAFALSACQQTAPAPQPVAVPSAPNGVTRSDFRLPDAPGCAGDVARFQAVMDNDLETGHVNKKVYEQVSADIDRAAIACKAGKEGEASAMIRGTKSRFGYP
jgi:hypothetical protein